MGRTMNTAAAGRESVPAIIATSASPEAWRIGLTITEADVDRLLALPARAELPPIECVWATAPKEDHGLLGEIRLVRALRSYAEWRNVAGDNGRRVAALEFAREIVTRIENRECISGIAAVELLGLAEDIAADRERHPDQVPLGSASRLISIATDCLGSLGPVLLKDTTAAPGKAA